MFSRNLKYFRLKAGLNKKELADKVGLSSMAITNYENGDRYPDSIDIINKLSDALGIKVIDFLQPHNNRLVFSHGKYRKQSKLGKAQQQLIEMECENYLSRLFTVAEFLGGPVFPEPPELNSLSVSPDNPEKMAMELREALGFSKSGPILDLVSQLENCGFLICFSNVENSKFSGLNGTVNEHPYIVINKQMSCQRNRSNLAHELVHLMFDWTNIDDKTEESLATAVGSAFLLPEADLKREIGIQRKDMGKDMLLVAKEYQVSVQLLVHRAKDVNIIGANLYKSFCINLSKKGLQKMDLYDLEPEESHLLEQLVFRAVSEEVINRSKGAELLEIKLPDFNKLLDCTDSSFSFGG